MTRLLVVSALAGLFFAACEHPTSPTANQSGEPGGTLFPRYSSIPAISVEVPIAGDTYIRNGKPRKNQGDLLALRIRQSGRNRALVQIDQAELDALVSADRLVSAHLEFTIVDNGNNWGTDGRTIDIHRMTEPWAELGATWNCGNDIDTSNQRNDCEGTEWHMHKPQNPDLHPWAAEPTSTALIQKFQVGTVTFDVTDDVLDFLNSPDTNNGWLIKKTNEGAAGRIEFGSRESEYPPSLAIQATPAGAQNTIAFTRRVQGVKDIFSIRPDGSGLIQLTHTSYHESNPAWSPDGTQIAYGCEPEGNVDICLVNHDGSGAPINLTPGTPSHEEHVAWSPDGTQISFTANRDGRADIYILDVATGEVNGPLHDTYAAEGRAVWSRDGRWLLFYRETAPGQPIGHWQLFTIDLENGEEYQLTWSTNDSRWGEFSPDGSRVAYVSTRDGYLWQDQIWIADFQVDSNGHPSLSNHTNLTHEPNSRWSFPSWSPDGSALVAAKSRHPSWEGALWILYPDGSFPPEEVTDGSTDHGGNWTWD